MRHWKALATFVDNKRDTINKWEVRLLAESPDTVALDRLKMALEERELGDVSSEVHRERQARMKESFDDLILLFCCASEAEQLCLKLSRLWFREVTPEYGPLKYWLQTHSWVEQQRSGSTQGVEWFGSPGFEYLYNWKCSKADTVPITMGRY